jgi:hypothetical protein
MLRNIKDLEGYTVRATDGPVGQVADFYFDDYQWVIRYLIVAIGEQLPRRKVLISPISIARPPWSEKSLNVSLTQHQVKMSPDIDTDKPVSRQHEMGYLGYYGYGAYWGGGGLWGAGLYPDILQAGLQQNEPASNGAKIHAADPHLRSGNAILRYYVHASDGDIGHVQGILIDEETWAIRYMIVNTSNWWLGHQVLIAPAWVSDVSWTESTVSLTLTRQQIKEAPPYDPAATFAREQESSLHSHYGRHGYWIGEEKSRVRG